MDVDSLDDLFEYELRVAYAMETRLVDALAEMAENASNEALSSRFDDHREETETHVERLEAIFAALDLDPAGADSTVGEAIDAERLALEDRVDDRDLLNVYYVVAGMRTERLELASYDGLCAMAGWLNVSEDVTERLEANRREEADASEQLRTMAQASDVKALWEEKAS